MTQQATGLGLTDFVKAAKTLITEVDGAKLQAMRNERPNLLILDVRESSEHVQGYIEGAMLVPRGILEAAADYSYPKRVQTLVDARERPIVVYCATGGRSAMAAVTLKQMGFREVYSLAGGIVQWNNEQRPLLREATYV